MTINDITQLLTALGTFISILGWIWMHRQCKDTKQLVQLNTSDIAALQSSPQPPSVDQVMEMYTTADRTLKAVGKLLRGQGRTIQYNADKLIADQQPAKPVLKTGGGVGGIIRRSQTTSSQP